jgi:hypothetical protein
LAGTSAAAVAQAAGPELGALVRDSSLVVQSRVARIDYRMAGAGSDGRPGVPYTIVTYDVAEVLRGSLPGRSVTLRYIGGPDGRGGFLEASEVPIFQVGDQDILFVRGNGESGCPLVDCADGRYRILDGAVYDGHGSPVQDVGGGRSGPTGRLPTRSAGSATRRRPSTS